MKDISHKTVDLHINSSDLLDVHGRLRPVQSLPTDSGSLPPLGHAQINTHGTRASSFTTQMLGNVSRITGNTDLGCFNSDTVYNNVERRIRDGRET